MFHFFGIRRRLYLIQNYIYVHKSCLTHSIKGLYARQLNEENPRRIIENVNYIFLIQISYYGLFQDLSYWHSIYNKSIPQLY